MNTAGSVANPFFTIFKSRPTRAPIITTTKPATVSPEATKNLLCCKKQRQHQQQSDHFNTYISCTSLGNLLNVGNVLQFNRAKTFGYPYCHRVETLCTKRCWMPDLLGSAKQLSQISRGSKGYSSTREQPGTYCCNIVLHIISNPDSMLGNHWHGPIPRSRGTLNLAR